MGFSLKASALSLIVASLLLSSTVSQSHPWRCGRYCECTATAEGCRAFCEGPSVEDIPKDLPSNLTTLRLIGTNISVLRGDGLMSYRKLQDLHINADSALTRVHEKAFAGTRDLSVLVINNCKKFRSIDEAVFQVFKKLRVINLKNNQLEGLPDFLAFRNQESTTPVRLDLDNNDIQTISSRAWCRGNSTCSGVVFSHVNIRSNLLRDIAEFAFTGAKIIYLDLSDNVQLKNVHKSAFSGIEQLHNLSLSNTTISSLPTEGLQNLRVLHIEKTPSLTQLPATAQYYKLRQAYVHYPHHCCAFRYPKIQDSLIYEEVKRKQEHQCAKSSKSTPPSSFLTELASLSPGPPLVILRKLLSDPAAGGGNWGNLKGTKNHGLPMAGSTLSKPTTTRSNWVSGYAPAVNISLIKYTSDPCATEDWNLHLWREDNFNCTPAPNAFNPCVDVLEADWLRGTLWVAALLTLIGNVMVLMFTICVRAPLTVTKFLVCNLAMADLALGMHLVALAAEDASSMGEYFNHAFAWQYGGWCDAVGFISVFGAELSVFTLSVITLERWYAISHAIHLTKRMQMRHAVFIMGCGWTISAVVALMPIVGVSSYRMTSTCLPFKYETVLDKGYVIFILVANIAAFVIVLGCYVSMFLQVRGSNASNTSDAYIARRMSLLVFTDFICWGPVAILAALSAGGINMDLSQFSDSQMTHAKIVLAIFYPFNACANPFLYAMLTKQFQNDLVSTLSRCGICQRKLRCVMETLANSHSFTARYHPSSVARPSNGSIATQCTMVAAAYASMPATGGVPSEHQPMPSLNDEVEAGFERDAAPPRSASEGSLQLVGRWPPRAAAQESIELSDRCPAFLYATMRCSGRLTKPFPAAAEQTFSNTGRGLTLPEIVETGWFSGSGWDLRCQKTPLVEGQVSQTLEYTQEAAEGKSEERFDRECPKHYLQVDPVDFMQSCTSGSRESGFYSLDGARRNAASPSERHTENTLFMHDKRTEDVLWDAELRVFDGATFPAQQTCMLSAGTS